MYHCSRQMKTQKREKSPGRTLATQNLINNLDTAKNDLRRQPASVEDWSVAEAGGGVSTTV